MQADAEIKEEKNTETLEFKGFRNFKESARRDSNSKMNYKPSKIKECSILSSLCLQLVFKNKALNIVY